MNIIKLSFLFLTVVQKYIYSQHPIFNNDKIQNDHVRYIEFSILQRCMCVKCNNSYRYTNNKVLPMLFVTFPIVSPFSFKPNIYFKCSSWLWMDSTSITPSFLHCPIAIASLHQRSHRRFRCGTKNYMAWLSHTVLVDRIWQNRPFLHKL